MTISASSAPVNVASAILYGQPAPDLITPPPGAVQVSPLVPGSTDLVTLADQSVDHAVVLAPPGTQERDYVLAQVLRVLKPGGDLWVLAPKSRGGARLRKALEQFGCQVTEDARRHHRFCHLRRPESLRDLAPVLAAGAPRRLSDLGLWTQPGVFSWDRLDPGSALLLEEMPTFTGTGADLGGGIGILASRVLASPAVQSLWLVELDRRALDCARRNLDDPRVQFLWQDVRQPDLALKDLDFVAMNPPFHDGGTEDRSLGAAFIRAAAAMLRRGGVCWITANRHLPYEAPLSDAFAQVTLKADRGGYKVYEARK